MAVLDKAASEAAYVAKGKAEWDAHEWSSEARDAHGRWMQGWGEIKGQVDGLLASGKITKRQHDALLNAAARHAHLGRGIPADVKGNPEAAVRYLASTIRGDIKTAYKAEGQGSEAADKLGKSARNVEKVAAAMSGKPRTGAEPAIQHPATHPDDLGDVLSVLKQPAKPATPVKADDPPSLKVKAKAAKPSDVQFDPRTIGASDKFGQASEQLQAARSAIAQLKDSQGLVLPDGIRLVGGQVMGMVHGGKSQNADKRLYRLHTPDGKPVDLRGEDNAAKALLNASASSTHADSLGDAQSHTDRHEPYVSDAQKARINEIQNDGSRRQILGYDNQGSAIMGRTLTSGAVNMLSKPVIIDRQGGASPYEAGMPFDAVTNTAARTAFKPAVDKTPAQEAQTAKAADLTQIKDASGKTYFSYLKAWGYSDEEAKSILAGIGSDPNKLHNALNGQGEIYKNSPAVKAHQAKKAADKLKPKPQAMVDAGGMHALGLFLKGVPKTDGQIAKHAPASALTKPELLAKRRDLTKAVRALKPGESTKVDDAHTITAENDGIYAVRKDGKVIKRGPATRMVRTALESAGYKVGEPTGEQGPADIPEDKAAQLTAALPKGDDGKVEPVHTEPEPVIPPVTASPQALEADPPVIRASEPKVVKKSAKSALDKVAAPKVVKKVQAVKVAAGGLEPGDVVTEKGLIDSGEKNPTSTMGYPKLKPIEIKRTVLSVSAPDEDGDVKVTYGASEGLPDGTTVYKPHPGGTGSKRYVHNIEILIGRIKQYKNADPGVHNYDQLQEMAANYQARLDKTTLTNDGGKEQTLDAKKVVQVKRAIDQTKATGTKIKLAQAPTTPEFKTALDDAMSSAQGVADIQHLNPANRNLEAGHNVGHAQQLLYDMAVGKLNGVASGADVKTDDDYRTELGSDLTNARQAAVRQTPYLHTLSLRHTGQGTVSYGTPEPEWADAHSGKYLEGSSYGGAKMTQTRDDERIVALPGTATEDEIDRFVHASHGEQAALRYSWHLNNPDASFSDWLHSEVMDNFMTHQQPNGSANMLGMARRRLETARAATANAAADKAEHDMLEDRRAAEGTQRYETGIPTYDSATLEPQTWDSIATRAKGISLDGMNSAGYLNALRNGASKVWGGGTVALDHADNVHNNAQYDSEWGMKSDAAPSMGEAMHMSIDKTLSHISEDQRKMMHDAVSKAEADNKITVTDFVPSFHTQGMVEDGVLYHRREDAQLDYGALQDTLRKSLALAQKSVEGQTTPKQVKATDLKKALDDSGAAIPLNLYHKLTGGDVNVAQGGNVPQSLEDAQATVNMYAFNNPDDANKIRDAINAEHAKVAGQTDQRRLPTVDLEDLIKNSVFADDGDMDSLRKAINSRTSANPSQAGYYIAPEQQQHMLGGISMVEQALARRKVAVTNSKVGQDSDAAMRKVMEGAGAVKQANNHWMKLTSSWNFRATPGDMYVISEGGTPLDESAQLKHVKTLIPQLPTPSWGAGAYGGYAPNGAGQPIYSHINALSDAAGRYREAKTLADARQATEDHEKAVEAFYKKVTELAPTMTPQTTKEKRQLLNSGDVSRSAFDAAAAKRKGADKAIEYVPWQQTASSVNGAGYRSMKGRLTLRGYTPEEATAKLKELGIVGDLEPHVPADAIFRSGRRIGDVVPLHPAYVRGESAAPELPFLIAHGLTARDNMSSEDQVKQILNSGGLMSIADRFDHQIKATGSSMAGDVGSGIDHVVFCRMDSGSGCGQGAAVRVAMRPDAAMRRDILLANRDYGGGKDRHSHYNKFRETVAAKTGEAVGKGTIWDAPSPEARALHIQTFKEAMTDSGGFSKINRDWYGPSGQDGSQYWYGNAEFNLSHQVRVEDMQAICCTDQPTATAVQAHLQKLLASGVVSRIPDVISGAEWTKTVNL